LLCIEIFVCFLSSLQTVRFGLFRFRSFVVLLRITYLVFPTKFLRISPDYSGYSTFIGMQDAVEVTYRPPHIFDLKSVHMMSLNFDHFMLLHTGSRPTGLIPMTHAPETDAISQLLFPAPVYGTCVIIVMRIWNRIRLVHTRCRRRLEHCTVPSQQLACA